MMTRQIFDAHRHLGVLPAYPFYGGPPVNPDITARATVEQLVADLDAEGTERALVIPNYGVPDPDVAVLLQRAGHRGRPDATTGSAPGCGSPRARRTRSAPRRRSRWPARTAYARSSSASCSAARPTDPAAGPAGPDLRDGRDHDLVVHVHTSPGAASDIDEVGHLVDRYADHVPCTSCTSAAA